MVEIKKLEKNFKEFCIKDLDLKIEKGEIFSLIGESGSGKSTLLRVVAGLDSDYSGSVLIDGKTPEVALKEGKISVVFQDSLLLNHLNVEKNIKFGGKFKNLKKEEIENRCEVLMELLELTPYRKKMPLELSGGQRQRVNIARSLIGNPKMLLMDEPFSALDTPLRLKLQKELQIIRDKFDITILFITHDQEEAFHISNRIGIIRNGEILILGTPYDIYNSPNTSYVANFLGMENIFSKVEFSDIFKKDVDKKIVLKSEDLRVSEKKDGDFSIEIKIKNSIYKNGFYEMIVTPINQVKEIKVKQNRVNFVDMKGLKFLNLREENIIYLNEE